MAPPRGTRNELSRFEDSNLRVAFKYPKAWGRVLEREHLSADIDPDIRGERIVLSFENVQIREYSPITLTFSSPDFIHSGFYTGSRFVGQEDLLRCNEFRFDCHIYANEQGSKVMSYFEVFSTVGDFGYNTRWVAQLINSDSKFKAIEIRYVIAELNYSQDQPKTLAEYMEDAVKRIREGSMRPETRLRVDEIKLLLESITTDFHE